LNGTCFQCALSDLTDLNLSRLFSWFEHFLDLALAVFSFCESNHGFIRLTEWHWKNRDKNDF